MRFSVFGMADGSAVEVVWTDEPDRDGGTGPRLIGPPAVVAMATALVDDTAPVEITTPGPTVPADLADPVVALATIRHVLDRVFRVDGDVPETEPDEAPPADAVQ